MSLRLTVLQSDDLLVLLLRDSGQSVQMLQRQLQDNRLLQMSERLGEARNQSQDISVAGRFEESSQKL